MADDPQMQVDSEITRLAEEYAECDRDSKDLSDRRKEIRDRVEARGIHKLAWQHAITMTKKMTPGERRDYQVSFERVIGVIGDKQMTLFPEETERLRKREERKGTSPEAAKAAADAKSDASPKSDPDRGGAAAELKKAADEKEAAAWAAANPTTRTPADDVKEQAEGAAALAAAAPATAKAAAAKVKGASAAVKAAADKASATSKKRSQSEQAKDKLAAAGMN